MNTDVFGKTIESVRKQGDIKLVTTERRNYLMSERIYHITNFFIENLLATEIIKKKTEILMNKSA